VNAGKTPTSFSLATVEYWQQRVLTELARDFHIRGAGVYQCHITGQYYQQPGRCVVCHARVRVI